MLNDRPPGQVLKAEERCWGTATVVEQNKSQRRKYEIEMARPRSQPLEEEKKVYFIK